jgi:dTDP-glucose pyrophosphorylase
MKIVLTMAGAGSRLRGPDGAASPPKPFIDVGGRAMVLWALDSVRGLPFSDLIVVALERDRRFFDVGLQELFELEPQLVFLSEVSDGQLRSSLAARDLLNTDEDLLIMGADSYVESRLCDDIRSKPANCSGILTVADAEGTRWSFARADAGGRVVEVAEKVRISDNACAGLYYFTHCQEFLDAADEVVKSGVKANDEFYVIQVYQEFIRTNRVVTMSRTCLWDMGTPAALAAFHSQLPFLLNRWRPAFRRQRDTRLQ